MTIRRVVAMTAVLMVLGATAAVAQTPVPWDADCDLEGDSVFTAGDAGWYAWVWREGTRIRGAGVEYLDAGEGWSDDTPTMTSGATKRFGVVRYGSRNYAYVPCD